MRRSKMMAFAIFGVACFMGTPTALAGELAMKWGAPKVTVVPLPRIKTAYDANQEEPQSVSSFLVSDDGQHYADVKRVGLRDLFVEIDGKTGPAFKTVGAMRTLEDFSRAIFSATSFKDERLLVIQEADGSAKTYPVEGDGWLAVEQKSFESGCLVQVKRDKQSLWVKVGDHGAALGPFLVGDGGVPAFIARIAFDSTRKHSLIAGQVLLPNKLVQSQFFLDDKPFVQDLWPPAARFAPNYSLEDGMITPEGLYCFWLARPNGGSVPILNGKVISPTEAPIGVGSAFSPDGKHYAFVRHGPHGDGAALDGDGRCDYDIYGVHDMQFSGDSKSFGFIGRYKEKSVLVMNGKEGRVENTTIQQLLLGPLAGQYEYTLFDPKEGRTLVLNGNRIAAPGPFGPPATVQFAPDGQHLFGVLQGNNRVFVDGATEAIAIPPGPPRTSLHGVIGQLRTTDATHWSFVYKAEYVIGAAVEARNFYRIDVEIIPATSAPAAPKKKFTPHPI